MKKTSFNFVTFGIPLLLMLFFVGCFGGVHFPYSFDISSSVSVSGDDPPALLSAASISGGIVEVTFDRDMDPKTASDPLNYTINGLQIVYAQLDKSNPTKVVLVTSNQTPDYEYVVICNDVKDAALVETIGSENFAVFTGFPDDSVADTICPTVVSAEAIHSKSILVTFSEPMDMSTTLWIDNFQIEGLSITNVLNSGNALQVMISTSEQKPKAYTVVVNGATDLAGNIICTPNSAEFDGTTMPDLEPPNIQRITVINNSTIQVQFSESIEQDELEDPANYSILDIDFYSVVSLDGTNQVAVISTAPMENKLYLLIGSTTGIHDLNGNSLGTPNQKTFTGMEGEDTYPPYPISAKSISSTEIAVSFSEPVEQTSAETVTNYSIDNLSITHAERVSGNSAKVILTTEEQSEVFYTLSLEKISDATGNTMDEAEEKIFFGDARPCIENVVAIDSGTTKVTFTEAVFQDYLTEYTEVNNQYTVYEMIPDSENDTSVYLYHTNYVGEPILILSATGVKDRNGNTIDETNTACSQFSYVGNGEVDTTKPEISEVLCLSSTEVLVVFNDRLDQATAEDANNYVVIAPEALAINSASLDSSEREVTLTTDPQNNVTYDLYITAVEDYSNNVMDDDTVQFSGDTQPRLVNIASTGNNQVRLEFNEGVDLVSSSEPGNYSIVVNSGEDVPINVVDAERDAIDNRIVWLETESQGGSTLYTVTVSDVNDLTGNAIDPTYNSLNFNGTSNYNPPKFVSATAPDGLTVILEFDEEIEETSAENIDNYYISDFHPILDAERIDGEPNKVRLTTANQSKDETYFVVVQYAVKDLDGHGCVAPNNTQSFIGQGNDPVYNVDFSNDTISGMSFFTTTDWSIYDHPDADDGGDAASNWTWSGGTRNIQQGNDIGGFAGSSTQDDARFHGTFFVYNDPGGEFPTASYNYWIEGGIQVNGSGGSDTMISFVWRFDSGTLNHYRFSWYNHTSTEAKMKITRVTGNDPSDFVDIAVNNSAGSYILGKQYFIRIVVQDYTFKCYVDGKLLLEGEDTDITNRLSTGTVGYGIHFCSTEIWLHDIRIHTM